MVPGKRRPGSETGLFSTPQPLCQSTQARGKLSIPRVPQHVQYR